MARLPTPGSDNGTWGNVLNDFLAVSHKADGTLQNSALQQAGGVTSVNGKSPSGGSVAIATTDLSDTAVNSPTDNQVLTYSSTSGKWANQTPAAGVQLDTTAADIQPIGVQAAGAIGKAADAGHVHPYQPWQFHVKKYGAKGDGKMLTDVGMTSGSKTLTSASASFTSADVGKSIMVNNAGPGGGSNPSGALITTIATVTNATTIALTAAASATVSAMTAVYGTNDTAAIQTAMAALSASPQFTSLPYYAELLFDPAVYVMSTYPVPGGSGTYGFAQIPLPVIDTTGTKTKPTVVIRGTSDNSTLDFWQQGVPQLSGTCLLSMIEVTSYDGTYGAPSVIGGPTITAPFTHQFNNVLAVIDGISVVCPVNPGQIAYDFYLMCQFAIKTASADVFGSVTNSPTIQFTGSGPTNTRGLGLRVPTTGLNDRCDIDSLSIEGYYYGMIVDEHVAARRVAIIYTNTALYMSPPGGGQLSHAAWIGYASLEICNYCLYVSGGGGSLFGLNIDVLDNEGPVTTHIYDPSNALTGRIGILPSGSQSLPVSPIVVGANNLEIISMAQTRGAVTAPSIPTSGTAFQNPFWHHASVNISGGTVSAIAVAGTTLTGVTSGVVFVPSGETIKLTYSVAPSWNWILL